MERISGGNRFGRATVLRESARSKNMNIIKKENISIVTCEGAYDLPRWSLFLRDLDDLDCPAIVDLRGCEGGLIEIDAYLLALQIDDLMQIHSHRVALVQSPSANCGADFFAICSRNRGLEIEVFESLDSASVWVRGLNGT